LSRAVADYQRQLIAGAVSASGDNWAEAARRLGTDPSNLHRMAGRLGLKQTGRRGDPAIQR
jgi:anaerobic nitric oxide reductase transcription regulator